MPKHSLFMVKNRGELSSPLFLLVFDVELCTGSTHLAGHRFDSIKFSSYLIAQTDEGIVVLIGHRSEDPLVHPIGLLIDPDGSKDIDARSSVEAA